VFHPRADNLIAPTLSWGCGSNCAEISIRGTVHQSKLITLGSTHQTATLLHTFYLNNKNRGDFRLLSRRFTFQPLVFQHTFFPHSLQMNKNGSTNLIVYCAPPSPSPIEKVLQFLPTSPTNYAQNKQLGYCSAEAYFLRPRIYLIQRLWCLSRTPHIHLNFPPLRDNCLPSQFSKSHLKSPVRCVNI